MSDLKALEQAMDDAATFIQQTWQQVVLGSMNIPGVRELRFNIQLRNRYADSIVMGEKINIPQVGMFRRNIIATDKVAEDLENGRGAWDMKPGLLNGPKARIGKDGKKFNVIPFRHGTPSKNPDAHFRQMPKDIYALAKQLKAGGKGEGSRLTGTEGKYPPLVHRVVKVDGTALSYQRKNGPYEGMVRIAKDYEKGKGSLYLTFRVVSEKSDPNSWWHPGFEAHDIARGVEAYCRPTVEESLRAAAEADIADGNFSIGMRVFRGL